MPTRSVDIRLLRRAFDLLVPPAATPKQYLRWKELARLVGLGEHWIRKRYQDRDRSELEVKSLEAIRKALELRQHDAPDDALKTLIEQLAAAEDPGTPFRLEAPPLRPPGERLRLRVVNVGFLRSTNANYCQRLEAGILFGMLDGLQLTHLINNESIDLGHAHSPSTQAATLHDLLARFTTNPAYVDRTYIVPLGTVATATLAREIAANPTLRKRLGKDLRVIFAGVTEPETTGILKFSRDYIGGLYAGNTFADRLAFIADAFPSQKISFLFDPDLPQDVIAREHVLKCHHENVHLLQPFRSTASRLPAAARNCLVTGYTVINWRIHELTQANPRTPFIGVNVSDLGGGAILSTGNDDLRFGIECARRLLVPDCRNEINLRDMEILRPAPIYGINQKACNLHGLVPRTAARNRCTVVVE